MKRTEDPQLDAPEYRKGTEYRSEMRFQGTADTAEGTASRFQERYRLNKGQCPCKTGGNVKNIENDNIMKGLIFVG